MEKRLFNPLILLPGAAFWTLVILGAVTNDTYFYGLAAVVAIGSASILLARKLRSSSSERQERRRVWTEGTPARARIVSIGTRGGGINDNPKIDFELDVMLDGQEPYRVSMSTIISSLAIPRIQPDCEIAVRVDKHDKHTLVVDEKLTPYGYK